MFSNLWPRTSYFFKDFSLYLIIDFIFLILTLFLSFKILKFKFIDKKKKFYLSLVYTAFVIAIVFSAQEAYFRYVYDEPDALGFLNTSQKWTQRHVVLNNYFFRDRDFKEKPPQVTRVGIVGDSITFGAGIKNPDDRFSTIVEKKLQKAGENVEVYNLGRPGYDTDEEIEVYNSVKHLNFDIIIWQYFLNDIQPKVKSTGTRIIEINRDLPPLLQFITKKSYFADFLYWRFSARYQKTIYQLRTADLAQYQNQTRLAEHQAAIESFIKSLKNENKKIVVVIFPSLSFLGPDYPAREIHAQMAQFFQRNNVDEVIDFLEDLKDKNPQQLMAGKFDSHPNEFVHNLVAEKLFLVLAPLMKK